MYYPETREQLQLIIKNARGAKTGLVPVSSGAPHLHKASENDSAEIVSFERMNRVLKIDRLNRYIRVESGVTFGELIPLVTERGMRLNMPLLPRASKSVVSSALEREAVLVPKYQYDYTDPLLTLECVFGTGEDFRTGSAAGPGPVEEMKADMVIPWGPGTIDYLRFLTGAQGTIGFVTWATLKTEVLPAESRLYFIESDELSRLTRLANELLRNRVLDDCVILNAVNFAAAFSADSAQEKQIRDKAAPWTMICRICGFERHPHKRIKIYEGYLQSACQKRELNARTSPDGLTGLETQICQLLSDCDRRETYWKLKRGGLQDIQFLSPPSATPKLVDILLEEFKPYLKENVGITLQPQVQGRAFRVECDAFFNPLNTAELQLATECRRRAEHRLFAQGAFFDRPYGELADLVYSADTIGTKALRQIKDIFDPDGILNPGKLCF